MKNIKFKLMLLVVLVISSCTYLDIVPDNVATFDDVFENRAAAERALYTCYSYLPIPGTSADPALESGDEIVRPPAFLNNPGVQISKGFQMASNPNFDFWSKGRMYEGIRNCNLFLERIDGVPDIQAFEKEIWTAEAKFLKAYYHFYLLRMYGPIVISDIAIPVASDITKIAPERSNIDKSFLYVLNLLDESIKFLPPSLQPDDYGRATRAIAASVKAEVAVTYASPMFNGNTIYSSFKNSEGMPYFPLTFDEKKWTDAVKACEEAIGYCQVEGKGLWNPASYKATNPQSDITLLIAGLRGRVTEPWSQELIWGSTRGNFDAQTESIPKFFQGVRSVRSNRGVSMRIAEQFYSKNGVPIEEDISYNFLDRFKLRVATNDDKYYVEPGQTTANLHFDREPRFYADLAFDRGTWFGNGREQTDDAWYVHGRDGEYGGKTEELLYSASGYLTKKFVNIKSSVNSSGTNFSTIRYPFPIMRYSDLILLYAEALNESKASPDVKVYEQIDIIRKRAGLDGVVSSWANFSSNPSKPTSKQGMRAIIQQERLIELMGEGSRFWDLRRWLRAKEFMNKPVRGWNVLAEGTNPEVYYTIKLLNGEGSTNFEDKDYLWPINTNEIINVPSLSQNPGWK